MADRPDTVSETQPASMRRPRPRQRMRTPQEARQWRRRMAGYALAGVSFVLIVNAIVGENGYFATMRQRRDVSELTESIRQMRQENERTREEIRRLKEDPAALEEAARRELRLSKPGERLIILKDAPKSQKPKTPPAAR